MTDGTRAPDQTSTQPDSTNDTGISETTSTGASTAGRLPGEGLPENPNLNEEHDEGSAAGGGAPA